VRPRAAALAAATLVCAAGPANGADDVAALRTQLEQVKRLVADLDARLSAVEADDRKAAETTSKVAAPAATSAAIGATAARPSVPAPAPAAPGTPAAAGVPAVPAVASATADSEAVPRAAWRRVGAGSSQDEVKEQLGVPTRTFELSGKQVWYYVYPGHGAGSVFFDSSGHVSSLQAPASW
jgi:hypothetical protein